jgi:hypothetical protein
VAVLLLWKNNIVNFIVNVQENNIDDCMLLTDNNDDECEVVQIVNRCRPNKITQLSLVSSV